VLPCVGQSSPIQSDTAAARIVPVQARAEGALPAEALEALQGVEGTGVLETMAAMDALNGLEPLAAAAAAPDGGGGGADECAPAGACACVMAPGGWFLTA
jgi:hypothetical protein